MKYLVLQRFIEKVRQAARTKNRALNVSIDEAQDLANELAILLLQSNELLAELNQLKSKTQITDIVVKGGSFSDKV